MTIPKISMMWLLVALIGTGFSVTTVGCGDDDGDDDAAGDGDGDGDGAMAGDGDGDGGDGAASCISSVYPALSDSCKTCICNEDAAAASVCDEACWNLVDCAATLCAGDTGCAISMCMAYLGATTTASAVGPAVTICTDECTADFVMMADADAGM